jgi:hypothetical protein
VAKQTTNFFQPLRDSVFIALTLPLFADVFASGRKNRGSAVGFVSSGIGDSILGLGR